MAYKWSWAFGSETPQELIDYGGWVFNSVGATFSANSNTIKHSYAGDASDRYSMGLRGGTYATTPFAVGGGEGWFSAYFWINSELDFQNYSFLTIKGLNSGYDIVIQCESATRTLKLQFGGGGTWFTASSPLGLAVDTWHHIGVKYNMTIEDKFSADVFINGTSEISGSRSGNANFDSEQSASFTLGGVLNGSLPTYGVYWSDLVAYDSQADPNPFGQFVTRVEPYFDSADSGTWAPDTNSGQESGPQATNLSGAVATSPVVAEADPLTGEYVRVQSRDLGTNLGLTSFDSFGFTSHLFASGSSATNIISKFKFGSPNPPFISGTAVIDGENAYAYASSGSTSWTSGSAVFLQAEISGS